jgi:hypothetical protein
MPSAGPSHMTCAAVGNVRRRYDIYQVNYAYIVCSSPREAATTTNNDFIFGTPYGDRFKPSVF